MTGLSFMHIYGQRAQVPGSVIIDGEYFEISCQFLFFIAVRCGGYLGILLFQFKGIVWIILWIIVVVSFLFLEFVCVICFKTVLLEICIVFPLDCFFRWFRLLQVWLEQVWLSFWANSNIFGEVSTELAVRLKVSLKQMLLKCEISFSHEMIFQLCLLVHRWISQHFSPF